MLLGGLRRHHAYAGAAAGIPEQWRHFQSMLPLAGQIGTTAYGVICGHDAGGFEYLCGVEVESLGNLPREYGRMRIVPQRYAVFLHAGPIAGIRDTWEKIFAWLPASGHASAEKPDFEVYDQRFDPAAGNGDVEIWIAIIAPDSTADPH